MYAHTNNLFIKLVWKEKTVPKIVFDANCVEFVMIILVYSLIKCIYDDVFLHRIQVFLEPWVLQKAICYCATVESSNFSTGYIA